MHGKKLLIDYTDKTKIRLHADLFGGRNILPSIGGYQYGAILTNETMHMRFLMTMKLKNAICN